MNIKNLVVSLILIFAADFMAAETRQHYVVVHRDRKPAYEITRIHDQNPSVSRRTYLIADTKGPLIKIDLTNDYAGRQMVSAYQLLRGSRSSAKVILDLPVVSATRDARREELRKNPDLANKPVPVTIHGAGKTFRGIDSDWRRADTAESSRGRVKDLLGRELLSALHDVRELAGLPMFSDVNAGLGYIFNEETLVQRSMKLMVANTKADCAFDAKFGVPCAR